jgi:uridine phosphorylase
MHHLHLRRGDVGRYVFLPGDPGRCERIASHFDDPQWIASKREYTTYTGTLLGEKVSVTSTGIGGPSAAIAVEELIMLGADTFIRVGTSGGMQPHIRPGDLAIFTGAIRDGGTCLHYMPPEFPSVAHHEVTLALREAALRLGQPHHLGIAHSKDSYHGQHEPERMPVSSRLLDRWKAWKMGGAICSEMEAATIFVLASIYRVRAGGMALMGRNQESDDPDAEPMRDQTALLKTATEGLKILIEQDRQNRNSER